MYLKRIEMKGFKSFADRTIIEFNNKITCVVGPNGSGKSNVADAFRWVLGEQSYKNLRSSNMSDVIFNGTKTRSALAFAEVCIVFDNSERIFDSDFLEISIKRRLYKSGESEYYINEASCRLKDIRRLLMDTGIGVEGYSIIAQGRIEQLLSANHAERRLIFEEAAGIVKYKNSKEESLKKLEKSQANIDRVNDIILELENRIEPLREQSEKAMEYKELTNELKGLEINVFVEDVTRLDCELAAIDKEINALERKKERLIDELNEFAAQNVKLTSEYEALQEKISQKNSEVRTLDQSNRDIGHLISLNEQRIELTDRHVLEIKAEIEKSLEERVQIDERIRERMEQTKSNLEKLQKECSMIQKHLEEKQTLEEQMKQRLGHYEAGLENLKQKLFQSERSLTKNKSEWEILKHQEQNNEGFDKSVKELLKLTQNDSKVHGTLRDMIELDEKFERAIESALGKALQNVVVEDREVATGYINLLKTKNLGRVTFLPLREIQARNIASIKLRKGFYGCAVDILSFHEKYRNLISYLLGNVFLVDSLEIANSMYREFPKGARVISLDGDLMMIGGAITGGSKQYENKSGSILGRKKKIERLALIVKGESEQINKYLTQKKEYEKDLFELRQDFQSTKNSYSELESRLRFAKTMIKTHEEQLGDIEKSKVSELEKLALGVEQKRQKSEQYLIEISKLKEEIASAKGKIDKNSESILEKQEDLRELGTQKDSISKEIESFQAKNRQYEGRINDMQLERSKFDVDRVRVESKRENILQNLWDVYEIGYLEAMDYRTDFNYEESASKIKSIKSKLKKIGDVNLSSIEDYRIQKERYEFLTAQRSDLDESIAKLKKLIKEIDSQMKQNFLESFEKIRASFQDTFSKLFGGGNVDLELKGSEDVLEADIMINAQPPGKKLQTLELMSGGEKALTAIALLFAILSTNPSPFCILDEIEAALDDVNIFRFSEFLKQYSENSQFIIITHRRGTMEIADAIYGVTMEEQGVSKVLYKQF